jgi:hypothetical protein
MSTKTISVRIDESLYDDLMCLAEAEHTTYGKVIVGCLQRRIAAALALARLEEGFAALVSSGESIAARREAKKRLASEYVEAGGDRKQGEALWEKYPIR